MSRNGTGSGGGWRESIAACDGAPAFMKPMLWNFAYDLDAAAVMRKAQSMGAIGGGIAAQFFFEDFHRELLQRRRDEAIRAAWGKDHPMIGTEIKEDWT